MTSLIIVDDDLLALGSLQTIFESSEGIEVLGAFSDAREALEFLQSSEQRVDVVLSDVMMPGMDGKEFLRQTRKLSEPPKFVSMTALDTDEAMLSLLAEGASGYVIKSSPSSMIVQAVREAGQGGSVVSPASLNRLLGYLPPTPRVVPEDLSKSDQRLLGLLCRGKSNREIAKSLKLSESTVKKRVSALIAEFGASSRLDLVTTVLNAPGGSAS